MNQYKESHIITLTFGSMKKDRIFINISTVNSFLNGTILNVNECSQTIFFVTKYPLWILLINNAYMFIYRIFTYGYPLWSLLIGNVYKLVYRIFTCIDYFGCFIFSFGKKMTFSVFHYLTLSVRCEELDAHIN
jgi:hypothetical protein